VEAEIDAGLGDMGGKLVKSTKDGEKMAAMMDECFGMNTMEAHKIWVFCQRGWRPKYLVELVTSFSCLFLKIGIAWMGSW
jgi:hypothetical protein